MTKLYVGNLPFTSTEVAVRDLVASRAMQALSGQDFSGRPLKINGAQVKARSGGGRSR